MTILFALIAIGVLAALFGLLLGYAAIRFKVESDPLVDQIDEILPQTQCGQCGYPGCKPYAEAIANGDDINKCPPGGDATIKKLADLMGVEPKPLDGAHEEEPIKKVAFIREAECIGCTKCIQACPVDAISGAAKQM
ncbi:MAG: electron transport complex subunit RsxB, partial [Cellvibrionaceae bacterium]|nr:electron transport complex subunit RsxB [Cellvibrionaceae bacterium]